MVSKTIGGALAAALLGAAMLVAPGPAGASPEHPTLAETNAVVDVLQFRGAMQTDPAKAVATYAVDPGRAALTGLGRQLAAAGINTGAGWRYLLGTSVFTVTGAGVGTSIAVFYNPWVDSALFTVWGPSGKSRRIVDAAWVPGDLVRMAGAQIDPTPLWLRGKAYRPDALAQAVTVTVRAIETRFGDPAKAAAWRDTLGVKDAATFNRLITPMLALTLHETLLRIKALAAPGRQDDPKLTPLRAAVVRFARTVATSGFGDPLSEARETTAPMRRVMERINPENMGGLAPVAFVAGDGQVTVFFASTATADYAISVRFVETAGAYAPAQIEFLPYAAIYRAAAGS